MVNPIYAGLDENGRAEFLGEIWEPTDQEMREMHQWYQNRVYSRIFWRELVYTLVLYLKTWTVVHRWMKKCARRPGVNTCASGTHAIPTR